MCRGLGTRPGRVTQVFERLCHGQAAVSAVGRDVLNSCRTWVPSSPAPLQEFGDL